MIITDIKPDIKNALFSLNINEAITDNVNFNMLDITNKKEVNNLTEEEKTK